MEEKKISKRDGLVLAIAVGVAVLTVAAYVGYLNIPRHILQLGPELQQADGCQVTYWGNGIESTDLRFEEQEMEELLDYLEGLSLYPLPGRRDWDGTVTLRGDGYWMLYFLINGRPIKPYITMTSLGEISVAGRVYTLRVDGFYPSVIMELGKPAH